MADSAVNPCRFPATSARCAMRPLGEEGQRQLAGRALVCGCGALGSVIANTLVRAGVGHLRIVDRDFLELNNLQRQVLLRRRRRRRRACPRRSPPPTSCGRSTRRSRSSRSSPMSITRTSLELCDGVDVIVDGTDNFETRFLLNDAALKLGIPWVYGGCLGAEGQTMTILPGETPCLRCLMPEPPPPGTTPTCDTAGILAPIINVIASIQAHGSDQDSQRQSRGDQPLADRRRPVGQPHAADEARHAAQPADCPACSGGEFPWLDGERQPHRGALRPQRRAAQPAAGRRSCRSTSWPTSSPASAA